MCNQTKKEKGQKCLHMSEYENACMNRRLSRQVFKTYCRCLMICRHASELHTFCEEMDLSP